MSVTWRWYEGTPPSWGDMTDTTFLDDAVPGDTSTFNNVTTPNSFNTRPSNTAQTAESLIWAQGYLQQSHILTGVNFSCWTARTWTVTNPACAPPAEGEDPVKPNESAEYTVSVWDGAAFVQVATGTLPITQDAPSTEYFAISTTFPAVTTCWVIVTIAYSVSIVACQGLLISECGISDIRPQGASTGLTCYEGSPPTDGPQTEPIPPSDEDPGAASGAVTASRDCVISAVIPPDRNCVISATLPPGKSEPFPAPAADIYMIDADGTYGVDSDQTYGIDTNG